MRSTAEPWSQVENSKGLLSSPESDFVSIRGKKLNFAELVDTRLFDPAYRQTLREQLRNGVPFEHVVVDGWFNPQLLELVFEEFDLFPLNGWREMRNKYETTRRSPPGPALGPAAQTYFNLVNSGWFLELLAAITAVDDLIPDQHLYGGGLHESRNGGKFGVHRDFDLHVRTGLKNEMVLLTYLNNDWDPTWGGALELWDASSRRCVHKVNPDFGRSILLLNLTSSYHGHPAPLNMPEGRVRRSLASYYYTNPFAHQEREKRVPSVFLFGDRVDFIKRVGKRWTPPAVWDALKRVMGR